MILGDKIRDLRIKHNLTQQQLADKFNISQSTVKMIEANERRPGLDLLVKMADFFNVSTDYLLGRTDIENAIIIKQTIDGNEYEFEVDKNIYPDGLTREQVVEKLKALKRLEDAGFVLKE